MSIASDAGIDTTVCELCEEPLDGDREWERGLDGAGAHTECLNRFLNRGRRRGSRS